MLSVLITLIGGIALVSLPVAQYPRITPPGVSVSISYPGANAQVVADTVAAPIEQQVNGVPGMLYMSSQCGNDGSYSLTVTFDIDVDLKTALVMVQNRVTLAMKQLPTEVQNQGITIRKRTPDMLMIVNFYSPDDRYDDIYLSNYATINVKDELLRVYGVSDITLQGQRDYSIRIWLDPTRLAYRNMTAGDVADAIRSQNLDAPAGQIGAPPALQEQLFEMPISTIGRLHTPEQFGDIIVKVAGGPGSTSPTSTTGASMGSAGLGASSSGPGMSGSDTTDTAASTPAAGTTGASGTGSTPASTTTVTAPSAPAATVSPASTLPTSSATTPAAPATTTPALLSSGGDTGLPTSPPSFASTGGPGGAATMPSSPSVAVVRLRDVARIEMGAQNYNLGCTFDGKPSVGLAVYQLPGTNALDVADNVRKKMEELKRRFPEGVDYMVAYDTTPYIRKSVDDVLLTLIEAVILVGIVVLFFLQDWRTMILPMIDVPVSLIGTFAVMAAMGYTLNNLTLFGLVLAIGIVVDDAIVVLENIERFIATGLDPHTATLRAMSEVTGPIIAVALVLCAVFIPCAFISGITGQFFRQFAVTISVSTVISAINALTMTPSRAVLIFKAQAGQGHAHHREALPWWSFALMGGLVSLWLLPAWMPRLLPQIHVPALTDDEVPTWLRALAALAYAMPGMLVGGAVGWCLIRPVNVALGWVFVVFNRFFDGLTVLYGWSVGWCLRLSALVLLVYTGLLVLTLYVFYQAPAGFIPQQDQGRLIVNIQLPDAASMERTQQALAKIDRIARSTPGVAHTVGITGLSFLLQANSPNFASMFIVLDPFEKRESPGLGDTAIMARLRRQWNEKVKEAQVTVFGSAPVPGLGSAGGFKLIIEDRGDLGMELLQEQTEKLIARLQKVPGLTGVTTQNRANMPQIFLEIDRTKVAAVGVALSDVNQALSIYQGSLYVNSFNEFGRHWQVTLQAEGGYRRQLEDLGQLKVRNKRNEMVPLSTLTKVKEVGGPIAVTRYNLYNASSIRGNVQIGTSTGQAIDTIDKIAGETLPLSMKADWTELMFMQKLAGNTATYIFLLSVVCVFLALAALYESWSLPLAVILVVPLCLLCSAVAVLLSKRDVNIFVQIGLVVLVGLACKNAILIVEYARQLHQEGRSCFEATLIASKLRLRPILMTSIAFILGVIPLVVATGAGAEMRRSLGLSVFSGMIGVTVFGIFLTPVFFYVIQGLEESQLLSGATIRRFVVGGLGSGLGLVSGVALGKLGLFLLPQATIGGTAVGALVVLGIDALQRRLRRRIPKARRVSLAVQQALEGKNQEALPMGEPKP